MAEPEIKRPCNEGLAVKQVRIKGDRETVKERKSIAGHPFGTVKRAMDAGCCLCRGNGNESGEFALTFLAYNLKRAVNIPGTEKLQKVSA
jgi:transposase